MTIPYKMTLEEALKNIEEAKEIGYLNRYPIACIVLAEELAKANKHVEICKARVKKAKAKLKAIAALDPLEDSEYGFNEWGEAECFRKAQELAKSK